MKIIKQYFFDTQIYTTRKLTPHSVTNNVERMLMNAAFFYKECKRSQRTPRSFIKNVKERKERCVLL